MNIILDEKNHDEQESLAAILAFCFCQETGYVLDQYTSTNIHFFRRSQPCPWLRGRVVAPLATHKNT